MVARTKDPIQSSSKLDLDKLKVRAAMETDENTISKWNLIYCEYVRWAVA